MLYFFIFLFIFLFGISLMLKSVFSSNSPLKFLSGLCLLFLVIVTCQDYLFLLTTVLSTWLLKLFLAVLALFLIVLIIRWIHNRL